MSGVVSPYSGRVATSTWRSTAPSVHSTIRESADGECSPMSLWRSSGCNGMKSVSTTVPVGVRKRVRSTMVSSTYSRVTSAGPRGRIDQ